MIQMKARSWNSCLPISAFTKNGFQYCKKCCNPIQLIKILLETTSFTSSFSVDVLCDPAPRVSSLTDYKDSRTGRTLKAEHRVRQSNRWNVLVAFVSLWVYNNLPESPGFTYWRRLHELIAECSSCRWIGWGTWTRKPRPASHTQPQTECGHTTHSEEEGQTR